MRTSICLHDTGTIVPRAARGAAVFRRSWISAGRYLGLAALGVVLAVATHALLSGAAAPARSSTLAALAAGLGLIRVWQGFDSDRLGRALAWIGAGAAVIALAIAAVPGNAPLLASAFAIAGAAAAADHNRETGLWVPTAAASLALAILSLA